MNFLPHLKIDINLSVKEIYYRLAQTAPTTIEAMRIDGMSLDEFRIDKITSLGINSTERYKYTDQNNVDLICTAKLEFTNLRTNKKYIVSYAQPSLKPWQNANLTNQPIPLSLFTINQRLANNTLSLNTTYKPNWEIDQNLGFSKTVATYFGLQKDFIMPFGTMGKEYPPLLYTPRQYGARSFKIEATPSNSPIDVVEFDRLQDNTVTQEQHFYTSLIVGVESKVDMLSGNVYDLVIANGGTLTGLPNEYQSLIEDVYHDFDYDDLGIANLLAYVPTSGSSLEELLLQMVDVNVGIKRELITFTNWVNPLTLYRDGFQVDLCTIGDLHAQLDENYVPPQDRGMPVRLYKMAKLNDVGEVDVGINVIFEDGSEETVMDSGQYRTKLTGNSGSWGSPLVLQQYDGFDKEEIRLFNFDKDLNVVPLTLAAAEPAYKLGIDATSGSTSIARPTNQTEIKTEVYGRSVIGAYATIIDDGNGKQSMGLYVFKYNGTDFYSRLIDLEAVAIEFEISSSIILISSLIPEDLNDPMQNLRATISKFNWSEVFDGSLAEVVVDTDGEVEGNMRGIYNNYQQPVLFPITVPPTTSPNGYSYIISRAPFGGSVPQDFHLVNVSNDNISITQLTEINQLNETSNNTYPIKIHDGGLGIGIISGYAPYFDYTDNACRFDYYSSTEELNGTRNFTYGNGWYQEYNIGSGYPNSEQFIENCSMMTTPQGVAYILTQQPPVGAADPEWRFEVVDGLTKTTKAGATLESKQQGNVAYNESYSLVSRSIWPTRVHDVDILFYNRAEEGTQPEKGYHINSDLEIDAGTPIEVKSFVRGPMHGSYDIFI